MKLESIKVLHQIKGLYEMPRTKERFDRYLFMLQGVEKCDMILPISSFNPMGKELATDKLNKLIELSSEDILDNVIARFNDDERLKKIDLENIKVAINLVDDVEGSWSDYYSTDYKSKFEVEALLKRNFCTPIFWTSEILNEKVVSRRIEEYITRTLHWIENGKPENLGEMLEQEIKVQMYCDDLNFDANDFDAVGIEKFVNKNFYSEDYSINLNFFYGDEASNNLSLRVHGNIKNAGFKFAKYMAIQRKK